jgi:hypothetical protein
MNCVIPRKDDGRIQQRTWQHLVLLGHNRD